MSKCARCLELGKETPATHHAKVVRYYNPNFGFWLSCSNEGAQLCEPCLNWTMEDKNFEFKVKQLV